MILILFRISNFVLRIYYTTLRLLLPEKNRVSAGGRERRRGAKGQIIIIFSNCFAITGSYDDRLTTTSNPSPNQSTISCHRAVHFDSLINSVGIIMPFDNSVLGDHGRINFQIVRADFWQGYKFLGDQTDLVSAVVVGIKQIIIDDDAGVGRSRIRKSGGGTKSASKMAINSPCAVSRPALRAPALNPSRLARWQ